ncbi:MAG TPA: DUF1330 domain-containing protein [Solirubrobacterales bacterium]|nr:DUF1330 domain-containing protein [Solirubrobacterales bacterium]
MEPKVEMPNAAGFAELSARADEESPLTMLHLLAFKPGGGRERFGEYALALAPMLKQAGGRIIFIGAPGTVLLGADSWDLVSLVEYPSRGAFLEMVQSPEYQEIAHMRREALARGELHPIDSADGLT